MGYGWWIVCDGARMLINLKEAADIGRKIRVYGLSVREAKAAGLSVEVSSITAGTRAHYYPQSSEMTVLLVIESGSGRLLGGQIVGGPSAGKRIDVLATALWNRMQVEDLVQMDLAYAPPFSPVWDPVLTAARSAAGNTGRDAGKDAGPNAR